MPKKSSSSLSNLYNPPLILEATEDIHEDGKIIYKKGQTLYAFKDLSKSDNDSPLAVMLASQSMLVTDKKDGSGAHTFVPKDKMKRVGTLKKNIVDSE